MVAGGFLFFERRWDDASTGSGSQTEDRRLSVQIPIYFWCDEKAKISSPKLYAQNRISGVSD
jgi:hypothetical protein